MTLGQIICFSHRVTEGDVILISLSLSLFSSLWDHLVGSLVILNETQLVFASGFKKDKGSSTQVLLDFPKPPLFLRSGRVFLAKHLGWAVLVKVPQVLGQRELQLLGFAPTQSLSFVGMFWGSGGAVCGCKGGVCKTEPAQSGALALTSCFVVDFFGGTSFFGVSLGLPKESCHKFRCGCGILCLFCVLQWEFCGQFLAMCPLRGDGVALIHPKQCPGDLGTAGMGLGTRPWS